LWETKTHHDQGDSEEGVDARRSKPERLKKKKRKMMATPSRGEGREHDVQTIQQAMPQKE
jgi:hypothetical protein